MGDAGRLAWGDREGHTCIRLIGRERAGPRPRPSPRIRVYPSELLDDPQQLPAALPPMAGQVGIDERGIWFMPRFGFVAGSSYTVFVDADPIESGTGLTRALTILAPPDPGRPTTTVTAIYPTAASIPYNQLRLYVYFSAPMSDGGAANHVHLVDDASGEELPDALLHMDPELWDRSRRRLTVLLDPARLKRGLVPHHEAGYPLQPGRSVRVVVDAPLRDSAGRPLRQPFAHRYQIGPDVREHVAPGRWTLTAPGPGRRDPLVVDFDRPLDHGLLLRCLTVTSAGDRPVAGSVAIGPEERSWAFLPATQWQAGCHHLIVDSRLEDLAGNSVTRVFDRDLQRRRDDPRPAESERLRFVVGTQAAGGRDAPG